MKISLPKLLLLSAASLAVAALSIWGLREISAQDSTFTLEGTVTSEVTSDALAGVEVTLATAANEVDVIVAPYADNAVRRFTTTTDNNGKYSFSNVPTGDYVIFATGNDLADLRPITVVVKDDNIVDFAMSAGGSIIGTVTSATDEPIYGGVVTLFNGQLAVETANIRSDGSYLFPNIRPSSGYRLFAQTSTEAVLSAPNLNVAEGQALQLDLRVEPAARLSGRILSEEGTPIEFATVSIESPTFRWSGLSDASGNYQLNGAGAEYGTFIPGTYNIRVRADNFDGVFEQELNLSQARDYTEDFTLVPAGIVTGQVTSTTGMPLGDVTVSAIGPEGSEYTSLTQADGTFSLPLLNTEQPYRITAFTNDYIPESFRDINVGRGETLPGLNFSLTPGTFTGGVVVESSGDTIRNAIIDFYSPDGTVKTVLSKAEGVFTYDGLKDGDYVTVISDIRNQLGFIGTVSVGEQTADFEFVLEPTGVLSGNAPGALAVLVTFNEVAVSVESVAADGSYEIFDLPAGTYSVVALGEAGAGEASEVTIEPGGSVELELSLGGEE
jgi:hypothetical protein